MHAPTPVDNEYFGVGVEYFALRCSPRLLFIGINVLRASYFCLEVSVFLIVCIWMALILSDSQVFAVRMMFLLVLVSNIVH